MTQRLDHQTIAPDGMRALGATYQYTATKSHLPHDLLNLVYLRVSQINGCAYCISTHSQDLLKAGVAFQKLMLLTAWREVEDTYTERERAALTWAESLTLIARTGVPDADYQIASAQFSEKELVDLSLAIGNINAYNRLAVSFRKTPVPVVGL